jgi:hypothetical protein
MKAVVLEQKFLWLHLKAQTQTTLHKTQNKFVSR